MEEFSGGAAIPSGDGGRLERRLLEGTMLGGSTGGRELFPLGLEGNTGRGDVR